jgi:Cytochrome c bacterial
MQRREKVLDDKTMTATRRQKVRSAILIGFAMAFLVSAKGAVAAESMHAGIEKYEGTKTCLECHDTLGKEVALSLHYQLQAKPQFIEESEKVKSAGMIVSYCPPPSTVAEHNWLGILQPTAATKTRQPGGCGRCHIGLGARPNTPDKLTEADYANIDCLICHGPDYRRVVVKEAIKTKMKVREEYTYKLVPDPDIDILKVVRNVRKPTSEMCLRCHALVGGGLNYMDGVVPTADTDVHFSMGMNCTECHTTRQHKIAGGGDLKAQELTDVKIACDNCHTLTPHKGENADYLNRHVDRIACQTCHIPGIARDPKMPTIIERDWSRPVLDPKSGLFEPTGKLATNVRPEYLWWNRMMQLNNEPDGSKRDRKSKIYPWKRTRYMVIADAASGKPVFINSAVYKMTGDPAAAALKGAQESKQQYSGKWKAIEEPMLSVLNHQVAPKSESLQCDACHSENTILDFKALGMKSRRK